MGATGTNRWLLVLSIVLLSLTVLITLLGGIGTSCVAFAAERWGPRMAPLIAVKPIFQALVVLSVAAGLLGLYATLALGRGRRDAYRLVLLFLIAGLLTSGIQMYYSATLRGATAPNNFRVYLTLLTLVFMLLMRLPGLWTRSGFERPGKTGGALGAGAAMVVGGLVTLTTPLWAGPTHMVEGFNTVEVLLGPLMLVGAGLLAGGVKLLAGRGFESRITQNSPMTQVVRTTD